MSFCDINWKDGKMPVLSRILLALAGIILLGALFFPIWKMELTAPQYPEGLTLYLHAHKIAGDVESINGLNHYIGMKTLHTEDFIEFAILPYIIGFFALLSVVSALVGRKRWAMITLLLFILFGIVSLFDFYRWNYNYGHDLDPTAAIRIPGMAYQPPLIGYKQLLNFGVYSIPALGGILMLVSFLLMALVVLLDYKLYRVVCRKKAASAAVLAGLMFTLSSCGGGVREPRAVIANIDVCAQCKMTITDLRYAAEAVTEKGKYYVFDDITCMLAFVNENPEMNTARLYVSDFLAETEMVDVRNAFFIIGGDLKSPMNGNIAAFRTAHDADEYAVLLDAQKIRWEDLGL